MEDSVAATGRPAREMSINAGGDAPAQGHTDSSAQGSTQTPLFARFERLLPGGRHDASEYEAPGQDYAGDLPSPMVSSTGFHRQASNSRVGHHQAAAPHSKVIVFGGADGVDSTLSILLVSIQTY